MPERRLQKRKKMVLPVKIALPGKNLLVHTLDISGTGVRIAALREELQAGQMVSLNRGTQKAQFRIVWINRRGGEFHAGLEAVNANEKFWGVDLNSDETDSGKTAFLEVLKIATRH